MEMRDDNAIQVCADWDGLDKPTVMGTLFGDSSRGRELLSFEYDPLWLASGNAQEIDPALRLFRGRQFPGKDSDSFGIFLDSEPDRWGRLLMRRREALVARSENRAARTLSETDFLLGVHDLARMGALRFRKGTDGPFLASDDALAAPPWTRLRELEEAARHIDADGEGSEKELGEWLSLILAPGSSLGGARPKASVCTNDGSLWIAKFPARQDDRNSGAWEMTVHDLAVLSGVNVPEAKLERFSGNGDTFLTRRFDRTNGEGRLHFASAMTLLGKKDGAAAADGSSYLELAAFIMSHGAEPDRDLEELWRRIVFSVAVSNTDDHLRNHGFILSRRGWELSPAYDLNPDPDGRGLSLNIDETDNALDYDLALSQAPRFHLTIARAKKILGEVTAAVAKWKEIASSRGISRAEIIRMENAFSLA
jgi:serine/threonine-protein kinase HipA